MLEKIGFILSLIETVAIILGVGIAINELLLHNREEETIIRERSFRVASDILEYNALVDFVDLTTRYIENKDKSDFSKLRKEERENISIDINKKSYPILTKILLLENCIENSLCKEEISFPISCKIIINIDSVFQQMKKIHEGVTSISREKPLRNMTKKCIEWKNARK